MLTAVLADPDADRRASMRFALESGGIEVVDAASLQDALTRVAEQTPHIVVLADELCRAIPPARLVAALRAQPETAAVRLVLALDDTTGVDAEGADAVVTRPVAAVELVRAVVA